MWKDNKKIDNAERLREKKETVSSVYLSISGVNGLIGLSPFSIYKLPIYEKLVWDSDCHVVQFLFYLQQTCGYTITKLQYIHNNNNKTSIKGNLPKHFF